MIMALLLLPASAMAAAGGDDAAEGSSCLQNLVVSGGFSSGKTFLASQDHEGVSYPVAFNKTLEAIRNEGMLQISPNETTGYIAAENPIHAGSGATVPLRVTVRRQDDGSIRVEARFTMKGGLLASKKTIGAGLCKIVDAPSL